MQKHERDTLAAAIDEAAKVSGNLTVTIEASRAGHTPKKRLVMTGPGGTRYMTVASTPRTHNQHKFARQWVRSRALEILP